MKAKPPLSLGDPFDWSKEKRDAIYAFREKHGRWPRKEITICLGCGAEYPCKSDCPCGTGKALE